MEFPINENSLYPLVRKCVERMFASRTKPMSEKMIDIWVGEIVGHNFTTDAIEKATKEFVESEDYNLSLPVILKLIGDKMTYKLQHNADCPFCEGTGTVGATLAFEMNGKLIDGASYLLNCYCNKRKGNLRMNYDKKSFHKTYGKDKYFRVFPSIVEKFAYQEKVWANGDQDINE